MKLSPLAILLLGSRVLGAPGVSSPRGISNPYEEALREAASSVPEVYEEVVVLCTTHILPAREGNSTASLPPSPETTVARSVTLSAGPETTSSGSTALSAGRETTSSGSATLSAGRETASSGSIALSASRETASSASATLSAGRETASSGSTTLSAGPETASSGSITLSADPETTSSGSTTEPDGPENTSSRSTTEPDGPAATPEVPVSNGYKSVLYFTNWGIYGANYHAQDIPVNDVTHVLYAFANIADDGEVVSSDQWADLDMRYPTDSWQEAGNNVYGCVKQLYLLKKRNRSLKVLISIGGWTYSSRFPAVAATAAGRKRFATSAVKLVADWGLDGLDIDWEYPQNPAEARDLVLLLQACRDELDAYAAEHAPGYHFELTVASPAGAKNYDVMDLEGMDPLLDAWHLMAYDYAGSWDLTTGHQAAVFRDEGTPATTKFHTEEAVDAYLGRSIAASKILLGVPLYGRSFAGTYGMGLPYSGLGDGSLERGVWLYKDLPRPGATVHWDGDVIATHSYDSASRELVTYDDVQSVNRKAEWMMGGGLGGVLFWEASGDKKGAESLVGATASKMRVLDSTQNLLSYPASVYDNMRNGME